MIYKRKRKQADGTVIESPNWYGRVRFQGREYARELGTPDRRRAETILRRFQKALELNRFDVLDETKKRRHFATLGQIFDAYRRTSPLPRRTVENNIGAMRALIRRAQTTDASDAQIDAHSSSVLTAALVHDFQSHQLAGAGEDQLKRNSATVTANSIRRQARSIFSVTARTYYRGLHLPTIADFLSARPLKEPSRYVRLPDQSIIDAIRAAAPALKTTDPNAYRIYLLAFGCGLRRKEIAFARWTWIRKQELADRYYIIVQTETDFRPKSGRDRDVPLEMQTYRELSALRIPRIDGAVDYILDGHKTERYDLAFDRFSAWMKGLGWQTRKQAHELRRIFGSYVTAQAGLSAAQDLLGHSDPSTTKAYYVAPLTLPELKIIAG
jgi:integrase